MTNFDISRYTHPIEPDGDAQAKDENLEHQNYNLVKRGKQDKDKNLRCLNNLELKKDGTMGLDNVLGYEVQHGSSSLNAEAILKLNVSDHGPHKNPGEFTTFNYY